MAGATGRRIPVLPHIWLGEISKNSIAAAESDQRQTANGGRRIAGLTNEARVFVMGDREAADEELADENAMNGTLILFGIRRTHEKIAAGDARKVRRGRCRHRGTGAALTGAALSRLVYKTVSIYSLRL
jgi:hypothetical protein